MRSSSLASSAAARLMPYPTFDARICVVRPPVASASSSLVPSRLPEPRQSLLHGSHMTTDGYIDRVAQCALDSSGRLLVSLFRCSPESAIVTFDGWRWRQTPGTRGDLSRVTSWPLASLKTSVFTPAASWSA